MTLRIVPDLPSGVALPWPLERSRSAWRFPLVAACAVTAAAHVPVTGEHLHEAFYIGALFIALEIAAVLLAIELLRRPTRAVATCVAVIGALAILALVLSRTIGLPLIGDDVGNWTEPLAIVSAAAEAVMVVGGTLMAARPAHPSRRVLRAGLAAGLLLLVAGGIATGVAVVAQSGGDDDMAGMVMGLAAVHGR